MYEYRVMGACVYLWKDGEYVCDCGLGQPCVAEGSWGLEILRGRYQVLWYAKAQFPGPQSQ